MISTYQSPEIVPDLGNVRVQAYCSGVCIKCIPILIDLVIQNTNGTPECGVAAISIHGLLIGFVRFGVFLLRHVASSEKVPALRISVVCLASVPSKDEQSQRPLTRADRFLQIFDRLLLAVEQRTLLMM